MNAYRRAQTQVNSINRTLADAGLPPLARRDQAGVLVYVPAGELADPSAENASGDAWVHAALAAHAKAYGGRFIAGGDDRVLYVTK
jgi:hypothetical protein